jgi:hypothetical protein
VANPTTNYGFVLPTASDLVTDLPADFDVALQGVDTRLKALQPGTTLGDLAYSSATANTNTRLGIGSTGQVLTVSGGVPTWASAGSGFVGAKAGQSTGTFPHDTLTTINYDSEDFDTDGFHNTSTNTNRFTVPSGKAGKYLCINNGMRLPNINMSDAYLTLRKNGTEVFRQYPGNFPSNGRPSIMNINVLDLAVADYIDYAFYQASGSSTSTLANGFVIFIYLGA